MIRMEIALTLILVFTAVVYFTSERRRTRLHNSFSVLLIVMIVHLILDGVTVYTVNHLDTVPLILNNIVHRFFIGSMVFVCFLFYQYIAGVVEEEKGVPRKYSKIPIIIMIVLEIGCAVLPVHYCQTPAGNYSDGIHAGMSYIAVVVYLAFGIILLVSNWKHIDKKKAHIITLVLEVEIVCCAVQAFHPTWLISGMGMTLVTMVFYQTLENPEKLRSELTEQKMSMLYLKSQVNPHFLYNTLDTIRIQAELNGDKKVAALLMSLVDFFRLSVKVDRQMVTLDDEIELVEAYMELICYRYPELTFDCDIDPDLGQVSVPNFILQPLVENSVLHGLKHKAYVGEIRITAEIVSDQMFEIQILDTGSGFTPEKKESIDLMLKNYAKEKQKLSGNSVGVINVQKRIKYLCGEPYGLSYTQTEQGVVTHLHLPL